MRPNKLLSFAFLASIWIWPTMAADIALIIDDMGNTKQDAVAFDLPAEVAFSILPHTHLSRAFSERAASQQREVMLHIPMEALAGNSLGPGALLSTMHPDTIRKTLQEALLTVPHAVGVNNHMGSKLTQLTLPMTTTMDFLQQQELFFVDSRTTRFSKAARIAKQKGVLSGKRNVFLDHFAETRHIDNQFKRLIRIAKKYDQAIGIAHPYPQSMAYLKQALPLLKEQGIRLIPPSEVLQIRHLANLESSSEINTESLE